ncbi:MAG: hybrid sensor histidine kinase/response regulator [Dehalococcoidia bacterium]|nr:MAG: hybrid sensor histidine kinase/response regulator [Dehalococcoidia bacterium]
MAGERERILVVDDEESVRILLKRTLTEAGYDVVTAANGQEALDKVSQLQVRVVLSDIKMPGISGIEVLRKLTADHPDICVIMATAVTDTQTAIDIMKLGAYDYISKPFNQDDLLMRVRKAIEKLELEEKIKESTAELEVAMRNAQVANQAKSDFLASMSHELRTPLTSILGLSEVLQEEYFGKLNSKQKQYLNDIQESGQHLLLLINDILDIAKIEAGKMELELGPVVVKELLENSLIMIKEKAGKHNIKLDVDLALEIKGLKIQADERKLKQIIFNLLSNAVKFTPDGGRIQLGASCEDEKLAVAVTDTGIGISLEKQEKVFQEFYQVEAGLRDKTPGTGLGLPLSRRMVEMHGGEIWCESEGEGKGSRFVFTIPLER